MKKPLNVLIIIGVSLFLFGCTTSPTDDPHLEIDVALTISGNIERVLETSDFNDMEWTEISITQVSRDGERNIEAQGVLLSEVLNYLEITDFSTITVIAEDEYTQVYDEAIASDAQTILVFYDGDNLVEADEGPIWLIAGNSTGNFSIRQLKEMKVE